MIDEISELRESPSAVGLKSLAASERSRNVVFWLLAAGAIAFAGIQALKLAWTCDDAFISFAYARNLARGFGLVYNVGERVEGYTNFLWTLLIAGGMRLGIDPRQWTTALGVVCEAGTIGLTVWVSWMYRQQKEEMLLPLPLTALALAVHHEFIVYGTSGLETSLYALIVFSIFSVLAFKQSQRTIGAAGFLAGLLILVRADGIVFIAAACLFLLLTSRKPIRSLIVFSIPVASLFVPYWIWRYAYYGVLFPNTFYAKSIASPYPAQGLEYLVLYAKTYYSLFVLPVLAGYALWKLPVEHKVSWTREHVSAVFAGPVARPFLLGMLFIIAQVALTIYIGGDFMFGRFYIMITPIAFTLIELLLVAVAGYQLAWLGAIAVIAGTAVRNDQFAGGPHNGYVSDEQKFYAAVNYNTEEKMAGLLHRTVEGVPLRVAFGGALASFVYYLDPQVGIDATTGLNDPIIARQPIIERGRPGHEKHAPTEYLLSRKIDWRLDLAYEYRPGDPSTILVFGIPAKVLRYNTSLMDRLRQIPIIQYTPIEPVLDRFIADLPVTPPDSIARGYRKFKQIYFDVNTDSVRENAILRYVRQ